MFDLLVIGGGVNGAGIARDAAGRGLRVLLCEKDDFAAHTSSASTKLIHGGLRYLEQYAFRLVRESLIEREALLAAAPHIIWPLRFVLPYDDGLRPAWFLRLGLFIYDHLGGRKVLPPTKRADLAKPPHAGVLKDRLRFGFEYSDCWVDDARLVALNAVDAAERGCDVRTRTACVGLARERDRWRARLRESNGDVFGVEAKAVVNAAGPWVDDVLSTARPNENRKHVRLIKGSHIIVRRLFEGDHCYIFQNADQRIVFAIPYEQEFTLIGTTDVAYDGSRDDIGITEDEVDYLLNAANEYFQRSVTRDDIASTYSGVRPLYDDQAESESAVTRDYVFDLDAPEDAAPILSVFGGKITTYRRLAEHALDRLAGHIAMDGAPWTRGAPLPGGDMPDKDFDAFLDSVRKARPWLPDALSYRLARLYGTRIDDVLQKARSLGDLGRLLGGVIHEAEAAYLVEREFAQTADDILWRRTKLGLHVNDGGRGELADWLAAKSNSAARPSAKVAVAGDRV